MCCGRKPKKKHGRQTGRSGRISLTNKIKNQLAALTKVENEQPKEPTQNNK